MKLIAAILCLIAVNCSAADLSGNWLGQGEWTYQGSGDHCYMKMNFEENENFLVRKGGYIDCSMISMTIEPARYRKKGTQLLNQDEVVVGSYENNIIKIKEDNTDNIDIWITIVVNGLHFDYTELWQKKDGAEIYNIQGRLFTNK